MSSFLLTNSIIFQDGYCTTNQSNIFCSISYMGIIISDFHIFQRGWSTTSQYTYSHNQVYNGNVYIQNGHLQLIYPLKMVIFHSLSTTTPPKNAPKTVMNFVRPWRDEEIFESLRQAFQHTKEDGRIDNGGGVVIGATCGDIHYI